VLLRSFISAIINLLVETFLGLSPVCGPQSRRLENHLAMHLLLELAVLGTAARILIAVLVAASLRANFDFL